MAKHQIKSKSRDLVVGFVMALQHQGDVELDSIENVNDETTVHFHDVGKGLDREAPDSIQTLDEENGLVLTHQRGIPFSSTTPRFNLRAPTACDVLNHFNKEQQ